MADGKVVIETDLDSSGIEKGLSRLGKVAGTGLKAATVAITGTTAALGGVSAVAIKTGSEFEAQMSRVQAISGATGENFEKLREQAIQLGADTSFSASSAAEGMENLAAAMVVTRFQAQALPDALALEAKVIYPVWDGNGVKYAKDHKVRYKDVLYKCLTEHTSQADWAPDAAPSLWAKVLIPDPEVIPEWEQPLSTNGYKKGDRVKHKSKTWESLVDNNVWEPGVVGTQGQWKEVV